MHVQPNVTAADTTGCFPYTKRTVRISTSLIGQVLYTRRPYVHDIVHIIHVRISRARYPIHLALTIHCATRRKNVFYWAIAKIIQRFVESACLFDAITIVFPACKINFYWLLLKRMKQFGQSHRTLEMIQFFPSAHGSILLGFAQFR